MMIKTKVQTLAPYLGISVPANTEMKVIDEKGKYYICELNINGSLCSELNILVLKDNAEVVESDTKEI